MTKFSIFKPYLAAVMINVIGTLLFLTVIRAVTGENAFVYTYLGSGWFIALFGYEIYKYHAYLKDQWQDFKKKKWTNILISLMSVLILIIVVTFSRKYFNQFIPANGPKELIIPINGFFGIFTNLYAAIINLMVAIFEEIAFRHDMWYRYRKHKFVFGILFIITNLLFGFSHYYNFNGSFVATIPYAFAGMILSLLYLWRRNIWLPIFTHFIFNFPAIIGVISIIIISLTR